VSIAYFKSESLFTAHNFVIIVKLLNDPELLAVFLGEKEVGFNTLSTTFAADVFTTIDAPASQSAVTLEEHKHVISLFKGPGLEAFEQQAKIITGIPAAQENILKHSVVRSPFNAEFKFTLFISLESSTSGTTISKAACRPWAVVRLNTLQSSFTRQR
jgi:hypothetical protein